MLPVLFHFGPVPVGTHDFFVLLGVLAAGAVFFVEARRRRMVSPELSWIVFGSLLVGALFARASTAWRYVVAVEEPTLGGIWLQGGRSILGGLAGAYLGALVFKRLVGYRAKTGDLFAPAVALGMAVGRWGCFLTEQIGTPTGMPWGITVSSEVGAQIPGCPHCASGVAMHPSFLYEIAFHALMFGALLWLRPRIRTPGELLKVYLLAYALFRFAIEFVRGNSAVLAGLSGSQLFILAALPLLAAYFWRQWRRGAYASAGAPAAGEA